MILAFFVNTIKAQQVYQVEIDYKEFAGEKTDGYKDAKKNLKEGDALYMLDNKAAYLKALDYYLKAYKYNKNNAALNFKIGYCYLETLYKAKALDYLEKAEKQNSELMIALNFYLGKALQYNYMFQDAIDRYYKFKKIATEDVRMQFGTITNKKIQECKNGIKFMNNIKDVLIQNISIINTEASDYSPLISADESILMFTSRRDGSSEGEVWEFDGQCFEDIYISYNKDGFWTKPKNVGPPLNTKEHDATVGLSADGQKLFVYRDMDIYVSELEEDLWSKPKKLPKTINSKANKENSASFSPDGKTIYFVRGLTNFPATSNGDIYTSTLVDGKWTEAVPLSDVINTKYDEDGIFVHPDGVTIYFSSKGHNTMGGYDIFKSVKQKNGTWSKPENMGIPVNSPDDDIYFVMAADGRTGYYSSVGMDTKGSVDIYKMIFLKLDKPLTINTEDNLIACLAKPVSEAGTAEVVDVKKVYLTIVKGVITDADTHEKLKASIEITDNGTGKEVMQFFSNGKTGKYLVSLPSGKNYGMTVKADGYLFHSENFDIPKTEGYQEIIKDVELQSMKKGSVVILRNVFFDLDKYSLRQESNTELNRLIKILKENPELRIEVSGHTDSQGTDAYNLTLSNNRAGAVVDYLIKGGINKSRLEYRGGGEREPIDTNKTKEGRQNNRRVQFMVL